MKVGDLVRSLDPWGPDEYGGEEYYPVGMVYQQHNQRPHRWWVRWISHEHLSNAPDCMLDDWLEVISGSR